MDIHRRGRSIGPLSTDRSSEAVAGPTDLGMATRGFARRAEAWTEVARWLGVFWFCRCRYSNVATYRCYYCGKRAPAEVRHLVADTLHAAAEASVPASTPR